jgi:hypothetical protein
MLQNIRSRGSAFEPFQRASCKTDIQDVKEAIDTTRKNRKNAFNNLRDLFKYNVPKRVLPCLNDQANKKENSS